MHWCTNGNKSPRLDGKKRTHLKGLLRTPLENTCVLLQSWLRALERRWRWERKCEIGVSITYPLAGRKEALDESTKSIQEKDLDMVQISRASAAGLFEKHHLNRISSCSVVMWMPRPPTLKNTQKRKKAEENYCPRPHSGRQEAHCQGSDRNLGWLYQPVTKLWNTVLWRTSDFKHVRGGEQYDATHGPGWQKRRKFQKAERLSKFNVWQDSYKKFCWDTQRQNTTLNALIVSEFKDFFRQVVEETCKTPSEHVKLQIMQA